MNARQRELKQRYKQTAPRMGIWQIRNLVDGKVLVSHSLTLDRAFNRHRTQLAYGNHPNRRLQADWKRLGSDSFVFEELDELTPSGEPGRDYREELAQLELLWLDQLQPYAERGYNEPRKSREERLRMIAEKQRMGVFRIEPSDEDAI